MAYVMVVHGSAGSAAQREQLFGLLERLNPVTRLIVTELPRLGPGCPMRPLRKILNTLLYDLITGCRWCDVSRGPQWASKSATHRWQAEGTLAAMQARILGIAEERGMFRWEYGAVDGAFSLWQGLRHGNRLWEKRQRDPTLQPDRRGRHAIGESHHASKWR